MGHHPASVTSKLWLFPYGIGMAILLEWLSYHVLPVQFNFMPVRIFISNLFLHEGTLLNVAESLYYVADFHIAYYFYMALYGLATGQMQPEHIFPQLQLLSFAIIFILLPYCVYRIFHSLKLALLSPFLLWVFLWQYFLHTYYPDYWGMGWSTFFVIPFFWSFFRKSEGTSQASWKSFIAICMIAGFSNVIRANMGIGICCVALFLMVYRLWKNSSAHAVKRVLQIVSACLIALFSYTVFVNIIPNFFLSSYGYDSRTTATKTKRGGAWHTLYIGLGWDSPDSISPKISFLASENPYHIYYKDECGMEAVYKENHISRMTLDEVQKNLGYTKEAKIAQANFYSEGYFEIIKNLYFKAFQEHPAWFIGSYTKKFFVCIGLILKNTIPYIIAVCILWLFVGRSKKYFGSYAGRSLYGVMAALFAFGLLPGVMAAPEPNYLLGSIAAVLSICFLMTLEMLAKYFRRKEEL
jgi:hypothetical protein